MRIYFLSFLFILLSFSSKGQDSLSVEKTVPQEISYDRQKNLQPVKFNEEKLEEYKNEDEFGYLNQNTELNWWQKFKNWLANIWRSFMHWLVGDYKPGSFIANLVQIAPYLIIGLILGLIIWLFIRLNPAMRFTKKGSQPEVFLSEEERIIAEQDIPSLIKEALQEKNYRLAIRYYYLLILKELKERKIIDYQYQKTNQEYLTEIETSSLRSDFNQITRLYDFIWYGSFPVNEHDYSVAAKVFRHMEEQLKQKSYE